MKKIEQRIYDKKIKKILINLLHKDNWVIDRIHNIKKTDKEYIIEGEVHNSIYHIYYFFNGKSNYIPILKSTFRYTNHFNKSNFSNKIIKLLDEHTR